MRLDDVDLISCVGATAAAKPPYERHAGESFFDNRASAAVAASAGGSIASKVPGAAYAVHLQHLFLLLIIEIVSGVPIEHGKDEEYVSGLVGGVLAPVNGNGTCGVLLDKSGVEVTGPIEMMVQPEGREKLVSNAEHREVVESLHTECVAYIRKARAHACAGWIGAA